MSNQAMSTRKNTYQLLLHALERGFDMSYRSAGAVHVACGQCEALVMNGLATHESGCPNARHECKECNTGGENNEKVQNRI